MRTAQKLLRMCSIIDSRPRVGCFILRRIQRPRSGRIPSERGGQSDRADDVQFSQARGCRSIQGHGEVQAVYASNGWKDPIRYLARPDQHAFAAIKWKSWHMWSNGEECFISVDIRQYFESSCWTVAQGRSQCECVSFQDMLRTSKELFNAYTGVLWIAVVLSI